MLVSKLN